MDNLRHFEVWIAKNDIRPNSYSYFPIDFHEIVGDFPQTHFNKTEDMLISNLSKGIKKFHQAPSLKKTYCPPAFGIAAPSSAYVNAPASICNPPKTHASNINDADGIASAISPVVMKMPEPITIPITIIELSNSPS